MKKMSWISLGNKCNLYFEVPKDLPEGIAGWLLDEEELSDLHQYRDKYEYLVDLLEHLSTKLHAVANDSADIFFFAANHGIEYKGATFEKELKEVDKFLAEERVVSVGIGWHEDD